ncbi:MAG: ABC transporter permease subunit [Myxococcales bacterium]|nr:ABC transporter permease subunit [Myxococcales bacterium]
MSALAIARLDLAAIRRSRWLWFCLIAYALLAVVLVTASSRESIVLGFTGSGRVLLSFSHALVLILPLIALTATAPVIQRAREDGSLELLLSQPLAPSSWFVATFAVRYLALVVPLALALVGIGLWGQLAYGDPIPWTFLVRALAISAALLFAFCGIGACISAYVRDPARVITYLVIAWALGVALLDFGVIGMLLRWRVNAQVVFGVAIANPVEAARLALLSHLQPDLATYGPVGLYLAQRVGTASLFLIGVAWPVCVGLVTGLVAFRKFRRSDRV